MMGSRMVIGEEVTVAVTEEEVIGVEVMEAALEVAVTVGATEAVVIGMAAITAAGGIGMGVTMGHISRECNAPRQNQGGGNWNNNGGGASWNGNNGGGGWQPNPNEGASSSSSAGVPANVIGISKDLEESLKVVCLFSKRQIELEERCETEKRESEERRKRLEDERLAREEKNRVELEKKTKKEKKEAEREWKLEKLLAKQKATMKEEFEIMFDKKLRKAVVSEKAVKGKAPMGESSSEEEEDPQEERLEKRKREAGVVYRGRPDAVDELIEIRVMYFSIEPAMPVQPRAVTPRPQVGGIVIREVHEEPRAREQPVPRTEPGSSGQQIDRPQESS
ncbi:hypothetical protein CBR_g51321, partial [Chara braunii]